MSDEFWQRLEASIHKTETCWIWTGSISFSSNGDAYGRFWHDGKWESAHKLLYRIFNGDIREPRKDEPRNQIHHSCLNPLCVNPAHLICLTPKEHLQVHNAAAKMPPWYACAARKKLNCHRQTTRNCPEITCPYKK